MTLRDMKMPRNKSLRESLQDELVIEYQMAMLKKLNYLELCEWCREYCHLEHDRLHGAAHRKVRND